ncbi:hypothetical protein ACQP1W_24180 [Spirillospora sp. CA-255316]
MGQSASDARPVELHQASAQHHLAVDRRHRPALSMQIPCPHHLGRHRLDLDRPALLRGPAA